MKHFVLNRCQSPSICWYASWLCLFEELWLNFSLKTVPIKGLLKRLLYQRVRVLNSYINNGDKFLVYRYRIFHSGQSTIAQRRIHTTTIAGCWLSQRDHRGTCRLNTVPKKGTKGLQQNCFKCSVSQSWVGPIRDMKACDKPEEIFCSWGGKWQKKLQY